MVRVVLAKDVPIGNYAKTSQAVLGQVIGHGDAPADAEDQTPTVQFFVRNVGNAGSDVFDVVNLGGMEVVADLGPPPPLPDDWIGG